MCTVRTYRFNRCDARIWRTFLTLLVVFRSVIVPNKFLAELSLKTFEESLAFIRVSFRAKSRILFRISRGMQGIAMAKGGMLVDYTEARLENSGL